MNEASTELFHSFFIYDSFKIDKTPQCVSFIWWACRNIISLWLYKCDIWGIRMSERESCNVTIQESFALKHKKLGTSVETCGPTKISPMRWLTCTADGGTLLWLNDFRGSPDLSRCYSEDSDSRAIPRSGVGLVTPLPSSGLSGNRGRVGRLDRRRMQYLV